MTRPVLYSFRRCPYAIRARMAIAYSGIQVELREVVLKNKPQTLMQASAKGTVPVLILDHGEVIDESLDILFWALSRHDPDHWLAETHNIESKTRQLITENDGPFKTHLDHYKYADRYPRHTADYYRSQAEPFLAQLEQRLMHHDYLLGDSLSVADIALFPFIRQFSLVDITWFDHAPYSQLQRWLKALTGSTLFARVMEKHPPWEPGQNPVIF